MKFKASFLVISILFFSCKHSTNNEYIKTHEWKYGKGFYIGDFITLNGHPHELRENYDIYDGDSLIARVVSSSSRKIIIKNINSDEKGYYHIISEVE